MTETPVADHGLAAVYRDDPRLEPLLGPGGRFEVGSVVVDGVPLRDFVRAPRTVTDTFLMGTRRADLVHLVHEDERLTFADVDRRARALARELRASFGVARGDRVAIAMRNLPEFVISFWGAALLGAIVVPLNSWWSGSELVYALDDAGATVAFLDSERLDRVMEARAPDGTRLVGVRDPRGAATFDALIGGAPLDDDELARLDPDDPVTILYTSGTTGRPKGALGTNRGHLANLTNMAFGAARASLLGDRQPPARPRQPATLAAAPLFHIGGMAGIIGGPMTGTKMVLMRKWDVEEGLRLAVEEGVTSLGGVPAIAQQILEHPGVERLGLDPRSFPLGGAPVPPDLVGRAAEVFGDRVQAYNGYGLTETTSAVVTNFGTEFAAHPDSVGRPNLTADVRVVDAEGGELATGATGELCFRSPQVVKGYWNDAAATAASFRDGWFHTGDVGFVDADGFVHVVDRIKDVVIRGGENVYCVEVEAVLHEHPAVSRVAVVGLEERAMGERVCAVVVPRPGATVTLAGLRELAASRLAAFKCPEALVVVDELPETPTGKVAKNVVRERIAARTDVDRLW
jgi:acyl-CoA synthetase (AMP-forming)/AMP-acid ligase II